MAAHANETPSPQSVFVEQRRTQNGRHSKARASPTEQKVVSVDYRGRRAQDGAARNPVKKPLVAIRHQAGFRTAFTGGDLSPL